MTTSLVTLIAVVALLGWVLAWTPLRRRDGRHPVRTPFGAAPVDMDHARLLADLRALPDAPADVETRLRV
ncbi:hypothetical protein [Pseudonocardia pini]|uniref:hypothetical protein n=1 Tax=Pseudonocardia pini TaxID=2758030 RepID=UPI0015F034E0|nr:hypothetical protein [Pseudonocardia pini]